MLSAAGDVVDRVVGLEVGADRFVANPVDLRELLARLRAVLRRREAATLAAEGAAPAAAPAAAATTAPAAAPDRSPLVRMGRTRLDLEARRLTGPTGRGGDPDGPIRSTNRRGIIKKILVPPKKHVR